MLRIAELLEGACTGGQYVLFVPKESLVGDGRVPSKIGALKSEKLECVSLIYELFCTACDEPDKVSSLFRITYK